MEYVVRFDNTPSVTVEADSFEVEHGAVVFYRHRDVYKDTVAAYRYWVSVESA